MNVNSKQYEQHRLPLIPAQPTLLLVCAALDALSDSRHAPAIQINEGTGMGSVATSVIRLI